MWKYLGLFVALKKSLQKIIIIISSRTFLSVLYYRKFEDFFSQNKVFLFLLIDIIQPIYSCVNRPFDSPFDDSPTSSANSNGSFTNPKLIAKMQDKTKSEAQKERWKFYLNRQN